MGKNKFSKIDRSYWRSKKLSNGQTAVMFFSRQCGAGEMYDVGFVVGKNRKQCMSWYKGGTSFLDGKMSGNNTNVIELYRFATSTLKDFEEFISSIKSNITIRIEGADDRRFNLYKRVLTKKEFGYDIGYDVLIKKLK